MKKILIALCGGTLVIAGTVLYRAKTMSVLSADLGNQIAQIESVYDSIVTEHVANVVSAFELLPANDDGSEQEMTPQQRSILEKIQSEHAQLSREANNDLQTLNFIHRLQISLHEFINSFPSGHPIRDDESYNELFRVIGERGAVRKLLREYNDNAKIWNNRMQGQVGSLTASVGDLESSLYPYLRFDGKPNANQVINLGK